MLEWFSASFLETSYSVYRIHTCSYFHHCNLVEVATEYPWISATALAFLSAFMLISALIVVAALLIVVIFTCMILYGACTSFGNIAGDGLSRFMKWGSPSDPRNM